MDFKVDGIFKTSIARNTAVANRIGYTGKDTVTPIDTPPSAEMHKRLFAAYWQAAEASNHVRYTLVGGRWYTVEELANGRVKVTRQ